MTMNSAVCRDPCYGPPWANWVIQLGKPVHELFVEKLNQIMDERDVTDAALGRGVGVTRAAVGAWRSGRASPQLKRIARICEFFGVEHDYFLPPPVSTLPPTTAATKLLAAGDDVVERLRAYNELVQRLVRSVK